MYRPFVIGLGILAVVGLGYFINHADSQGFVSKGLLEPANAAPATTTQNLPGVYTCDISSGCENARILEMLTNGEVTMKSSFNNGVELTEEMGTWTYTKEGGLQILFTGTAAETYSSPRVLVVKDIKEESLSWIFFDGSVYPDWENPTFVKETEE